MYLADIDFKNKHQNESRGGRGKYLPVLNYWLRFRRRKTIFFLLVLIILQYIIYMFKQYELITKKQTFSEKKKHGKIYTHSFVSNKI